MDSINSPILGVPGIGQNLGAMIVAEIGAFSRFSSPDKILAFAGCSPSTYQSGQLYSSHAKMEKRGSRYLRWALLNATAYVCMWEPTFAVYLQKKRSEDKHGCFIINSEGEVLADVFTTPNTMEVFYFLLQRIRDRSSYQGKIKVRLEATGHYSYNILEFLLDNGLPTYVLNPLHTNLYRKSLSLRKTKTDWVDGQTIATMLLSNVGLKPYTDTAYHNENLRLGFFHSLKRAEIIPLAFLFLNLIFLVLYLSIVKL